MTELEKAARQALEQLEFLNACYPHKTAADAITALTQALATTEPVQDVTPTSGNILVDAFNEVQALKQQATTEPDEDDDKWRDVALRFDKHRMQALWHLQAMLKDPEKHADIVRQFLKDPTHPAAATTERKFAATPDHNGAPVPASPADMQVYDKIAAGYWTERKVEPVAYREKITGRLCAPEDTHRRKFPMCYEPLYTSPQVPEGVGLNSERYLWLRDMASQDWINHNHNYRSLRGAAFDAAIDAARKGG